VRAKGDFYEKITLEHDFHPHIIRVQISPHTKGVNGESEGRFL
jgi:hypothetical protein